jgi:hypothetical protein
VPLLPGPSSEEDKIPPCAFHIADRSSELNQGSRPRPARGIWEV